MSPAAQQIVATLARARLPLEDEKLLQERIGEVLEAAGIGHEREVGTAGGGRIDFAAPARGHPAFAEAAARGTPWNALVGIEVKIGGSRRDIHRQLAAYAADPRIAELIVVTGLALALPAEINGVPVTVVELGL